MFNPLFGEYAQLLQEVALTCTVACHRAEDAPLFAEDPAFDHATQGFGWSDSAFAYTSGRRFAAPTGLDAVLLYYRVRAQGAAVARGVDLYLFAAGRIIERVEVAHCRLPVEGPLDGSADEIPTAGDFDIQTAHIARDGSLSLRRVAQQAGQRTDECTPSTLLSTCPRHTVLRRVAVEAEGVTYALTGHEITQLEAAVAEHRGITDFVLSDIVDAVRCKYGELGAGAWQLVAGTLGMTVAEAQWRRQARDEWWAGYAAMHDGGSPQ